MSINISSAVENLKNDATTFYDKYVNKGREFEFNKLEVSLALRVAGIAGAIFGAVAAVSAVSAIVAFAPVSAVLLGAYAGSLLIISHDAIKIGDNISKQLSSSIRNVAGNAVNQVRSAFSNAPAEFQGTLIEYSTYKEIANKFQEAFC